MTEITGDSDNTIDLNLSLPRQLSTRYTHSKTRMEECFICLENTNLTLIHYPEKIEGACHMACFSCIEKFKITSPDVKLNCPLCRKNLVSSHNVFGDDEFSIFINYSFGDRIDSFSVKSSNTIDDIKQKVEKVRGIPKQYVRYVVFMGKQLKDNQMLKDCNIEKNNTITFGL